MTAFPHPVLVADIGGTNARFALAETPGGPVVPVCRVATKGIASAEEAIARAIEAAPVRPASIVICAACPVIGRGGTLTNASWSFDGETLARRFALAQGLLLNDFEAAALALSVLEADDVEPIGAAVAPGSGPKLVLGPGTGLGMAGLVVVDGRALPMPGEAGHVAIGPIDEIDAEFWPRLPRVGGRVTVETILCGPGLVRLHHALAPAFGRAAEAVEADPPSVAACAARGGEDAAARHCATSVRVFLDHLARFAGDMGLVLAATGGVHLRGGVMSSLAPLMDPQRFRALFDDKAPVEALARTIPLLRLPSDAVVMRAMARLAAAPERFVIDYEARAWVG